MQKALLIFVLGMLPLSGRLQASTFQFTTPTGAKDVNGVDPVSAQAIFSVSGSTITLTLDNTESNPTEDAQVLDALTFQLKGQSIPNGATFNLSMSVSEYIDVHGTGTYSQVTSNLPTWSLTDTVSGSTINFDFCNAKVSGTNCTSQGTDPTEGGVIGGAASNNKYGNANSTIRSSTANPYILDQVVFTISMSSGTFDTSQTNYTNLLYGFGDDSAEFESVGGVAPEPSTFWMMAGALGVVLTVLKYRHTFRLQG